MWPEYASQSCHRLGADTLGLSKLNGQMSSALQVMSNDIRRAGIWGNMTADDFAN